MHFSNLNGNNDPESRSIHNGKASRPYLVWGMGNSLLDPARLSTQPNGEHDKRVGNDKSNQR
jgi:hypothetical protein